MKALILGAAALSLALPVFAAENAANSPEQQVSQKEYREQKAAKQTQEKQREQLATAGISKEVTLEAAPAAKKAEPAKAEERHTLRFESWVHDEDNEY